MVISTALSAFLQNLTEHLEEVTLLLRGIYGILMLNILFQYAIILQAVMELLIGALL